MTAGRRFIHRQWRNGPKGQETAIVTWWHTAPGERMRIEAQDFSNGCNFYPTTEAEAEQLFNRFQLLAPAYNSAGAKSAPVVEQLLDSIRKDATDGQTS